MKFDYYCETHKTNRSKPLVRIPDEQVNCSLCSERATYAELVFTKEDYKVGELKILKRMYYLTSFVLGVLLILIPLEFYKEGWIYMITDMLVWVFMLGALLVLAYHIQWKEAELENESKQTN